jgi:hypothetical protein
LRACGLFCSAQNVYAVPKLRPHCAGDYRATFIEQRDPRSLQSRKIEYQENDRNWEFFYAGFFLFSIAIARFIPERAAALDFAAVLRPKIGLGPLCSTPLSGCHGLANGALLGGSKLALAVQWGPRGREKFELRDGTLSQKQITPS